MKVKVTTLTGDKHELEVAPQDTVKHVKVSVFLFPFSILKHLLVRKKPEIQRIFTNSFSKSYNILVLIVVVIFRSCCTRLAG